MNEVGSAISNVAQRMEETVELLGSAVWAVFLAAVLVVIPCVVALLVAVTFAVIHPGDDLDFGHGTGRGGDIIVLPAQPF